MERGRRRGNEKGWEGCVLESQAKHSGPITHPSSTLIADMDEVELLSWGVGDLYVRCMLFCANTGMNPIPFGNISLISGRAKQ